MQRVIGETKKYLLFLHAVTGCDTVSAIYRQGKRKAFNIVHTNKDYDMLDTFTKTQSTHEEVTRAGEQFLLKVYGANNCRSLDEFRCIAYKRAIAKSSLSSSFELASLPPTSASAMYHFYRTYLIVQEWLGNVLPPTEWGWKVDDGDLIPITTDLPVAPDKLLHMVSCGCKADGCGAACGCRKLGLYCTSMCLKCMGATCHNATPISLAIDDEEALPTPLNVDGDDCHTT